MPHGNICKSKTIIPTKKDMISPSSQRAYKIFVKEVHKWLEIWGFKDWEIDIYHRNVDGGEGYFYLCSLEGRRGDITLSTTIPYNLTEREIQTIAFHEVAHLLLVKLERMAADREYTRNQVVEETHVIINRLQCAIFDKWTCVNPTETPDGKTIRGEKP